MKKLTVLLSLWILLVSAAADQLSFEPGRFTMLNIVPFSPGTESVAAADCREYTALTGQRDCLYSLTLHPEGVPAMEKVERALMSYRAFASALKGSDVRPGILLQAILGHWPRTDKDIEPWQRTINSKGEAVRFCPLDPRFREYIREVGRRLAQMHPACIMSDDDVRAYSPEAECFCPLHVAEYNRRTGRSFTGETMREHVATLAVSDRDHKAFTDMMFETTHGVVKLLREGIDSVDPSIPGGSCMPGWTWDRSRAHRYAEAMCGAGRSFFRLGDGTYTEGAPKYEIACAPLVTYGQMELVRHSGYTGAIVVEADTCPQNLWAKSAIALHVNLAYAAFGGIDGAKIWFVNQRKRGVPVTRHYTDIIAAHRGYYDAIATAVRGASFLGAITPCYDNYPYSNAIDTGSYANYDSRTLGDYIFGAFGIPYRMSYDLDMDDAVYTVAAETMATHLTDEAWRKILSHKAILDGDAVRVAIARGFGDLIGVRLCAQKVRFTDEREVATGIEAPMPEFTKPPVFEALPGAEVLSHLVWYRYGFDGTAGGDRAAPASVFFKNRLGGTVVAMAYHMNMTPYCQYSVPRKQMLMNAMRRLDPSVVENTCLADQNMLVIARRAADGATLLQVINLNYDAADDLRFVRTVRPRRVERLSPHGVWREIPFAWKDGVLKFEGKLPFYNEAVLKISEESKNEHS